MLQRLTRFRSKLSELRSTLLFADAIVPAISLAACRHITSKVPVRKAPASNVMHERLLQFMCTQFPGLTSIFLRVRKAGFCWMAWPMRVALSACKNSRENVS